LSMLGSLIYGEWRWDIMIQIGVITTYDPVPEPTIEKTKALGKALAAKNCIVITGGNGGLMTVVSEAVTRHGGITVGIIAHELEDASEDHRLYNPYNTIRVKTGQTYTARSPTVVRSSDAIIMVAGGVGTLTELAMAYNLRKPIVVLTGTGLMADRVANLFPDGYLDHRKLNRIFFTDDPVEAVETAMKMANPTAGAGRRAP
jgi:uncharacterized protein (TIGR00725 family)